MSFLTWFDVGVATVIVGLMVLSAILGYRFAKGRYLYVIENIQSIAANCYAVWYRQAMLGECPEGVTEDFALIEATCAEAINGVFEREDS